MKKKLSSCVSYKVSIDHLFDNLGSGKRNNCFGKKSGKSLEFWIQNLYEPGLIAFLPLGTAILINVVTTT